MSKKLYVGNLSYQTTESELTNLFQQVGQVESATVIMDHVTGRSKGFGFVEMSNEHASQAISRFNGTEVNGRALKVNEARPRGERSERSGGGFNRNRNGNGNSRSNTYESGKGDGKSWWE